MAVVSRRPQNRDYYQLTKPDSMFKPWKVLMKYYFYAINIPTCKLNEIENQSGHILSGGSVPNLLVIYLKRENNG